MSFTIQSPNASPFSSDPPRAQRQQSGFRPPVAPSPGGYQQGAAAPQSSEGYFPPQSGGQLNMSQQPGYGAPYDGTPQDVQGLTQQMSGMNVDARAGTPHTRRKKDRHAYHQFEAPGAGAQGSYGPGPSGQFVGGNNAQASVPGQEASWQQGAQPWQSQKLPSQSNASQPSYAPAGTPINLGGGSQSQGAPPGAGGNKVNPALIPSVPASRDVPAEFYKTKVYPTMEQRIPPPASVPFVAYDQGNASPKHARLTLNCIPNSQEQLNTTGIPLGLIVQPLGKQTEGEAAIPVLDFGEAGPPRCRRCRAYVNPFMIFSNGGNRMMCNLCGHPNEVSPEYFSPTDPSGVRVDRQDRPELLFGSCEFLVPKEYWSKEPVGLRYLFLLDVSAESCTRGFLRAMCDGLMVALYGDDLGENAENVDDNEEAPAVSKVPAGAKVGFMTFDREVHSYNVNATLSAPQQLVMSDLEEPFSAISPQHLFVDPAECKTNIIALLRRLPGMFENIRHAEPALFPSLSAALSTLSESGGKIICSLSSLPTFGPGRLTVRDKGMQTASNDHPEQEKVLLRTENASFKKLHADMIKAGVGVDFFLNAPSGGYLDIATIGLIAEKTGGDTFYYPNWTYPRDTLKLQNELAHTVQREQGYAALMKVRCSNGLQISHYSGNFTQHTFGADLEMGSFTEDTAIGITFSYDTKVRSFIFNPITLLANIFSAGLETRCIFPISAPLHNSFWKTESAMHECCRIDHRASTRMHALRRPGCSAGGHCEGSGHESSRAFTSRHSASRPGQGHRHPCRVPEKSLGRSSEHTTRHARES
jgi:protein transport protein SEC24